MFYHTYLINLLNNCQNVLDYLDTLIFCCSDPTEEIIYHVPITADREKDIPATSITWTNIPPDARKQRGPENVIHSGKLSPVVADPHQKHFGAKKNKLALVNRT
jgi:hypothetical protein